MLQAPISIHLMLLLNFPVNAPSLIGTFISIHLMLLLNLPTLATSKHETHFNTSYVVIKRGGIKAVNSIVSEFQYILCCY